jgi:hypothetical protein
MKTNAAFESSRYLPLPLTKHAKARMDERRLSDETVNMVMTYGRVARVRGAEIYAVGRKEVEHYLVEGVDLSRFQGVQVVCGPDGAILTVYRNNDFRGLRPRGGRRHLHQRTT